LSRAVAASLFTFDVFWLLDSDFVKVLVHVPPSLRDVSEPDTSATSIKRVRPEIAASPVGDL
jgi:hypothetical protein